ncbi:hypothetical protein BDR26DRAFT_573318 [Obelidium mucronatum]|nr:hypothetical protein BDR26DRAFT_573318 [Obelidium mucronatum]
MSPVEPSSTWLHRDIAAVLSNSQFYVPFVFAFLINVVWFFAMEQTLLKQLYKTAAAGDRAVEKAKSWLTSGLSSSVLVLGGIPIMIEFFSLNKDETSADLISKDSAYSWALGAYFAGFLIADCFLGSLFYPKQFNILTGWIHHIIYLFIIVWHLQVGQIGIFMPCVSIAEVSTVILAWGSIHAKWRNDIGFGVSFFITRVFLHTCFVVYGYQVYGGWYWVAPAIPLPLHIHWFYNWFLGYSKAKVGQQKTE